MKQVSQIPSVYIPGHSMTINEALETYEDVYVVSGAQSDQFNEDEYVAIPEFWDPESPYVYPDYFFYGYGAGILIQTDDENGLNFFPSRGEGHYVDVKYMYMDRELTFPNPRVIAECDFHESDWTSSTVYFYLIPQENGSTIAGDIAKINTHINSPVNGIITLSFSHSGSIAANNQVGYMIDEIDISKTYKMMMRVDSTNSGWTSLFGLRFKTY